MFNIINFFLFLFCVCMCVIHSSYRIFIILYIDFIIYSVCGCIYVYYVACMNVSVLLFFTSSESYISYIYIYSFYEFFSSFDYHSCNISSFFSILFYFKYFFYFIFDNNSNNITSFLIIINNNNNNALYFVCLFIVSVYSVRKKNSKMHILPHRHFTIKTIGTDDKRREKKINRNDQNDDIDYVFVLSSCIYRLQSFVVVV